MVSRPSPIPRRSARSRRNQPFACHGSNEFKPTPSRLPAQVPNARIFIHEMKSDTGPPMMRDNAARARVRLIVWCTECQHQFEPDPAEAARYGAETTVPDWRERLSALNAAAAISKCYWIRPALPAQLRRLAFSEPRAVHMDRAPPLAPPTTDLSPWRQTLRRAVFRRRAVFQRRAVFRTRR